MTREEIDAIYDAKQNISPVNNTGITRAEIDAIFDGVANANNAQNMKSIQPTNRNILLFPRKNSREELQMHSQSKIRRNRLNLQKTISIRLMKFFPEQVFLKE